MKLWSRLAAYLAATAALVCVAGCCGNNEPRSGYALAIGLNEVSPAHYGGWDGALTGCEPDVRDMAKIAEEAGFVTTKLITKDATRQAVLDKFEKLAQTLEAGDLLVVSYSGHGGNVPDHNGDETDLRDETWVLYDGQLIDDELAQAWSRFREGVRILLLSDSCHSGTVLKALPRDEAEGGPEMVPLPDRWILLRDPKIRDGAALLEDPRMLDAAATQPVLRERLERRMARSRAPDAVPPDEDEQLDIFRVRAMPPFVAVKTYNDNREFYEAKGKAAPKETEVSITASVISISGCMDDQFSADLGFNGLFTSKLVEVWDGGKFEGGYEDFHQKIRAAVLEANPDQSPELHTAGMDGQEFKASKPYTISE